MIFDIYAEFDLLNLENIKPSISFKEESNYKNINGTQNTIIFKNGYVCSLNRDEFRNYYSDDLSTSIFVYGEVYTNNKYENKFKKSPRKITASKIKDGINKLGDDFLNYVKGNFVLIIYYKSLNQLKIFTDKLNTLPIYFSYKNGRLIISSNTSFILKSDWVDKSTNELAISMQYLFDYMLGEHYFFNGITRCENSSVYTFKKDGYDSFTYWDISLLYSNNLMSKKKSIHKLGKQLKKNVQLYSNDKSKILVSFTGGFDGRTNLALLSDRDKKTYKTYSYGMRGSKQIRIPKYISTKNNIDYEGIYLEKEYINSYKKYSDIATYFSNGTAPIGFSNIPYAFEKLSKYSDTVLTGLFGSEILRPIHNNGIQVNDNSFEIFIKKNYQNYIKSKILDAVDKKILKIQNPIKVVDNLIDFFDKNYFKKYKNFDRERIFFFFILQEGVRKYFSQEISIERVYVNTRIPYFDIDFVELIYKTTWAGMYNGFLGKSKLKRRKGQLLYAYIIKKYYPELLRFKLDRGYTPNDLILPFPFNFFKLALGVARSKIYNKINHGNDTFKTKMWSKNTIKSILSENRKKRLLPFGKNFYDNPMDNNYTFLTFRHFISIIRFNNLIR